MVNERRERDALPSKQVVTSLNSTFLYRLRRRSVPKKSVTDGSPKSFSLPSTLSAGIKKISHMAVSCLVLERISQVAWTSDKLSKELSLSLLCRYEQLFKQGEKMMQRWYPVSNEQESPLRHPPQIVTFTFQFHHHQSSLDRSGDPHFLPSKTAKMVLTI